MSDPTIPYNALPKLPPSGPIESLELYKALVPASEALAKLSATAGHLPNQAALYQSVALLEAKASSEIEQIVTTDGQLFSSESSQETTDPLTKEVYRYAEAMHSGWQDNRPLCTSSMEKICTIIKGHEVSVRQIPGTALKRTTGETIYTPPEGERLLRDLLDNLFQWMHEDNGIHPIIKAAIAHYQFETIHPFADGNGRTGRIMVVLYLIEQNRISTPALFLSGEILRNKGKYYELLQSTRETGDFMPYLIWFVNLVRTASRQSADRADKVREAMQQTKQNIRELSPAMYSQDLVNCLFKSPIIFAHQLVRDGVAGSLTTAHAYLKELASHHIIEKSRKKYNRKVGYINTRLVEALSGEIDLSQ